ncbi:hypothetical protein L207DRAFT_569350 [Hyaloscypha variabilis F]|uniref:Zn(2)-C6 fungal-type domain-containing protein n=1 Tax=Hyaloscypha variabilis (strain UAMH 11265 / GT02V1 / F) TaxID=1149755 RepID=A0A2J6RBQ5_HYAVF|nr:hypothetical protein L207DRAFT_569350 [Hyaloscypha variabilis F]
MQPTFSPAFSGDEDSSPTSNSTRALAYRSASADKPARKRRSAKKVKTGCQTCKIRRVKCDETKPYCQRCIKFGVQCDGYKPHEKSPVRAQTIQRIQSKALLPKHAPRPIQITAGVGFEDDLNGHCFRIYLDETAKQINGPFPNPLWSKLIPQISEQEPFVRSAIIAIGALRRHSRAKCLLQSEPFSLGFQGKDYQHALKLYEKSLRGMRDAILTGKHNLRNALIACLLVFIFEGMLGNQAAAAAHAESGLNLLFQSVINDIPGRSWEVRKAATHKYFEEDLLMAFSALDLQVLLFIDRRSKTVHEQMKSFQTRVIGTLPVEFRSLNEAQFFWQLIVNRNYHFLKSLQSLDMEILQEDTLGAEGGSANMDAKELLLSDPKEGPMTQKEEHLRYRIDIGRWTLAAQSLFEKIADGENEREKAGAALLMAQTKVSHIMLSGTFFTSESSYDVFLPEFTAIVNLAETILPYLVSLHQDSDPRFSVDIGIVPGIFLVASRCRFDDVRKRAIEMLFSCDLREGIWDALAVAHVARWLRSLELEGLVEGDPIPEEKRAVLSAINIDLHNKKANLGAIQRAKTDVIQRETSIAW